MSRKPSREKDVHKNFNYEVQVFHRSARDYIVDTRLVRLTLMSPPGYFDRYLQNSNSRYQHSTISSREYVVLCAARDHRGYDVPSGVLKDASYIVQ
ncbi:uncharacterized protein N7477_005432 [Penicillium maclennaniae]|uniref:uncharacterized protein n=1 Tax=Penicillium maclennaniae TaxID=1343394 RepID=UPI00254182DC|nr:uncharacterized protein N7477_005432 [Penicillium maclennaniae]KAJ5670069.1 hypothetical protein N7477_005432 [Penicillium maclennaniae]